MDKNTHPTSQAHIFEADNTIEQKILELLKLEDVLESVCNEVQTELKFEFAGISLVNLEQNTIEAIHGTGIAANWSGRVKHYLESDEDLRDIQADIVQKGQTEIILGWDNRFDSWVYDYYNHKNLVRIFSPILLIEDNNGKAIENWYDKCSWNRISEIKTEEGITSTYKLGLSEDIDPKHGNTRITIIGTIETGFRIKDNNFERFLDNYRQLIGDNKVELLGKIIAKSSLDIWRVSLHSVLKTIAEYAMNILGAQSASLHFLSKLCSYELPEHRYIYEVFAGKISRHFMRRCPPRLNGLGQQAIKEGTYKFMPNPSEGHEDNHLEIFNPKVFHEGVRAMVAFPLLIDLNSGGNSGLALAPIKQGVLYVDYYEKHRFFQDELQWGELFASRAVSAIRHAITYEKTRDRAGRLTAIHSIAQSFSRFQARGDLLRHIAWDMLNLLAADIVSIYEYIQNDKKFLTPPETAGRLKNRQKLHKETTSQNVLSRLIESQNNIYAESLQVEPHIFKDSRFAEIQDIKSAAGIFLKVGKETVGAMFISYRRLHTFSDDEKQIIETLASSAAVAIKNQRYLTTLSDIEHEIITTLDQDKLLGLIVERATLITGADKGTILRMDQINQELIIQSRYPTILDPSPKLTHVKLGEGVTGWVAEKHQSVLVEDVTKDPRYLVDYERVRSELCVPLLDRDHNLLGVLNVESYRASAFAQRDKESLEVLADHAVIAIINIKNKEQLVTARTMAILGGLAGEVVHKITNDFSKVRQWAQEILDEGDAFSKTKALEIQYQANQIIQGTNRLNNWMLEETQKVNILTAIKDAIEQVIIPDNIVRELDIKGSLIQVLANRQQLVNVFDNLIQNAVDAMPKGGRLSITSRHAGSESSPWIVIVVSDTGEGIREEDHNKIFKIDYSTKNSRSSLVGYGLWWVKAYIEYLGGKIELLESQKDKGSRFSVSLPTYRK